MTVRFVTKIGIASLAKISAAIYALMGLIFGTFMTLTSMTMGSAMGSEGAIIGMIFGIGAIIFLPIFYGIIGFISGVITAFIYNIVAKRIGGLEVEVE